MNMGTVRNPLLTLLLGTALVVGGIGAFSIVATESDTSALAAFASESELTRYVDELSGASYADDLAPRTTEADAIFQEDGATDSAYSATNVQVQGVDEDDIVKTDGEHIYLASYQGVTIIDAVPADQMTVIGTIDAGLLATSEEGIETHVSIIGLLLREDRLVVIGQVYSWAVQYEEDVSVAWVIDNFPRTVAAVYDVTDPSAPGLVGIVGISGWYLTSRAVDGFVYLVTNHYIYTYDDRYVLPVVSSEDDGEEIDATDVLYDPTASDASSFTNVLALDVGTMEVSTVSVLTGFSSTVYMSEDNLYLSYQKWAGDVTFEDGLVEPDRSDSATTTIHKIRTEGTTMTVAASGTVNGWLLNQFSLDEQDGFLRIATTTSWEDRENAVYVLGPDLDVVGALEGLAPGESIFSARFIGDRLYMVTFLQTDPLFVVDLSDPQRPRVLGELEMPGVSTYLHPVGDGLLLGVGMENWTLKVALYDVSDPENPTELGKYMGEEESTYSPAQYDHKAFLYDDASGRMVLPICSYDWGGEDGTYSCWQGFIVLAVGADTGVQSAGGIEHAAYCMRSLTIGDTLYTVSSEHVMANDLSTLESFGSLEYGDGDPDYYWPEAVDSV